MSKKNSVKDANMVDSVMIYKRETEDCISLIKLNETISAPREDVKPYAPKMVMLEISKDFIGAVIGPGGKIIQRCRKIRIRLSLSKKLERLEE